MEIILQASVNSYKLSYTIITKKKKKGKKYDLFF